VHFIASRISDGSLAFAEFECSRDRNCSSRSDAGAGISSDNGRRERVRTSAYSPINSRAISIAVRFPLPALIRMASSSVSVSVCGHARSLSRAGGRLRAIPE